MISALSKTNSMVRMKFNLSSTNAFNLDQNSKVRIKLNLSSIIASSLDQAKFWSSDEELALSQRTNFRHFQIESLPHMTCHRHATEKGRGPILCSKKKTWDPTGSNNIRQT